MHGLGQINNMNDNGVSRPLLNSNDDSRYSRYPISQQSIISPLPFLLSPFFCLPPPPRPLLDKFRVGSQHQQLARPWPRSAASPTPTTHWTCDIGRLTTSSIFCFCTNYVRSADLIICAHDPPVHGLKPIPSADVAFISVVAIIASAQSAPCSLLCFVNNSNARLWVLFLSLPRQFKRQQWPAYRKLCNCLILNANLSKTYEMVYAGFITIAVPLPLINTAAIYSAKRI